MSSIVVAGDTSGSVTIAAPAVAGSGTLTLPVATDTLAGIAATQTLTNKTLVAPALGTPASGVLTNCTGVVAGALPAGSVLQVVQTTFNDLGSINSATFISVGISISITPRSASNKVLVMVLGGQVSPNDATRYYKETIYRGATNLSTNASGMLSGYYASASEILLPHSTAFLDSPATTSSTTYTIYGKSVGAVYYNTGATGTLIAMEIQG